MHMMSTSRQTTRWLTVAVGLVSLLIWIPDAGAASSKRVKVSKSVPRSVARAPVCDTYAHPKILKVTPDPVKPGQKITIKGKNFGTKRCFKQVSFGRKSAKRFQYVNDTTLKAPRPSQKAGHASVNIRPAGGASA